MQIGLISATVTYFGLNPHYTSSIQTQETEFTQVYHQNTGYKV